MADRRAAAEMSTDLEDSFERWVERLRRTEAELTAAGPLVDRAFAQADAAEDYDLLAGRLTEVVKCTHMVDQAASALRRRVERVRGEWIAARRWTADAVSDLTDELTIAFGEDSVIACRRWLLELFDALDAQEWQAVERVANAPLQWPQRFRAGAERISRDLASWQSDDARTGLELMTALGLAVGPRKDGLERWDRVLCERLRSRAYRLAAWIALRTLKDEETALEHLDQAVALWPYRGRMRAERAAYFLFIGDFDRAATDAQHAIENAGESTNGYLELGTWSELTGVFDAADDLYRRGLERMSTVEMARLGGRASLIDPTGRLLARAAEELYKGRHLAKALELARAALVANVRGAERHPHAGVYQLRSEVLEELPEASRQEAGAAALKAGKLYMWNGNAGAAINQFGRAMDLDPELAQAGWLQADVLVTQSLPLGEVVPKAEIVDRAREAWDLQSHKGAPAGETSWAYLTRAIIADLATQRKHNDREIGIWTAIAFVERALVHDDSDAQRWGYAAQYLRYAQLPALALEATNEGSHLSPDDRRVLAERLLLLAARGPLEDADSVADKLVTVYGQDPLVGAVRALLALRRGSWEEALSLLKLPLAEGNDPLWYLHLQALCHLAGSDEDAAREACREMLRREATGRAPAIDGTHKCRLAAAAVMVGERDMAADWLARARQDRTTPAREQHSAQALLEAAAGDLEAGYESLSRAVRAASSAVEIDDIEREIALRFGLLDPLAGQHKDQLAEAVSAARTERLAWLERHRPSADSELNEALSQLDARHKGDLGGVRDIALLAVASRRQLERGDLQAAAVSYERLHGSFEPEASLALARAIRSEREQCAAEGDVEGVRKLQARLIELDAATPVDGALGVASALASADRLDDARKHLQEHLPMAVDDAEREELLRHLGVLALDAGDLQAARIHLSAALDIARAMANRSRVGRLEITLAVIGLLESDKGEVKSRLHAATEAWHGLPRAGESAEAVEVAFVQLVDKMRSGTTLQLSALADSIAQQWERGIGIEAWSTPDALGDAIDSGALDDRPADSAGELPRGEDTDAGG